MSRKVIDSVKKHIDRQISERLSEGFDSAREYLFTQHLKFKKMGNIEKLNMTPSEIEAILDTRTRYLTRYVYHADKRIKDLYRIERSLSHKFCKSPKETFIMLMFKERMEGKINYKIDE